ncbi:hypothetical protein [Oxalobacter formigenes]|uniref:capsular polysaccharide export protein, LipB/KpsS family n=1 Tax=Oxalobacter formigenes TaxID=847 RepID=UPI00241EBC6A|nr:hypothetical protein [Oxalobacter formigenes]
MSRNEIHWSKISHSIKIAKSVTFLYPKGCHVFRGHNLENIFSDKKILYIDDYNWYTSDIFISLAFGIETPEYINDELLKINKPILVAEETFLRSVVPSSGAPKDCPQKFLDAISHFLDARCPHFYVGAISSLEQLLNSDINFDKEKKDYSRKIISLILDNKLSKYNSQCIELSNFINNGKKNILLIDQVDGDMAVNFNGGSVDDFKLMLSKAIEENPNYNIIIKTHVDKRKGIFTGFKLPKNVFLYTESINILSLLERVDKLYVYSSAVGIEGILAGKEVHVFGSPIYAGWGLTNDIRSFPYRKKRLSVEELFYKIYIMYSHYCNPITSEKCEIEEAIEVLIKLRDEYLLKY